MSKYDEISLGATVVVHPELLPIERKAIRNFLNTGWEIQRITMVNGGAMYMMNFTKKLFFKDKLNEQTDEKGEGA